jgi:hypothetical protein
MMGLRGQVRAAVERRLARIEAVLAGLEGVIVERVGDAVRVRGRGLVRRSIDDVRLRFAGRGS